MKKIIDIKDISMNEKIALLATVAVLLMIITRVCYNLSSNEDNGIDYNENIDINYMINISEENTDRQLYLVLDSIIQKIINSYSLENTDDSTDLESEEFLIYREDYYEVLDPNYRKVLSKKKYNEISKKFVEKFLRYTSYGAFLFSTDRIEKVYKMDTYRYPNNMYICKLKIENGTEPAYIGIKLNTEFNKYTIFYIE